MRVALKVIEERMKRGKSAKSGEAYAIFSIRGIEDSSREDKLRDILEVTLSEDDNELEGTLEGATVVVDIYAQKPGFRGVGVECRGVIVRGASKEHVEAGDQLLSEPA